jgi:[histone H3]-dimethyl-L-lysine9 demethylase
MLYASHAIDNTEGGAIWDIYPPSASRYIRVLLKKRYPTDPDGMGYVDPIHSQKFYLNANLRQELASIYGVRGWRIYQKPGDAVFIPAGCAHQVRIAAFVSTVLVLIALGVQFRGLY